MIESPDKVADRPRAQGGVRVQVSVRLAARMLGVPGRSPAWALQSWTLWGKRCCACCVSSRPFVTPHC